MIVIENAFNLGDVVYIKTDPDQLLRMVLAIHVQPTGLVYELGCGTITTEHYEMEISYETNKILRLNS